MMRAAVVGWAVLALAMALLWWRQLRTRDATSVDVAWSAGMGVMVLAHLLLLPERTTRALVVAALALVWSSRLAWYLWRNRVAGRNEEDGRYQELRARWRADAPRNFFLFYQAQALVALCFSLPIAAAMRGDGLDAWAIAGGAVWAVAVAGEALADRQLAGFRSDPANRGAVCQVGLWKYSRHPNYFFEWLHWWSYCLIGHGAALTWLGPALMLFLLFRVTGIPYTEAQALRSRGERYRRYQRTTSVFIPWPPKESR